MVKVADLHIIEESIIVLDRSLCAPSALLVFSIKTSTLLNTWCVSFSVVIMLQLCNPALTTTAFQNNICQKGDII